MKRETLEALVEARRARRPVVLLTWLEEDRQELVDSARDPELEDRLARGVVEALTSDRGLIVEANAGAVFVQPYAPAPRLIIVGAVHIAQHLTSLAGRLGHELTVVDPRRPFASRARFPEARLRHEWPDAALDEIGLDARCAVVTLSHDPKLDDPALDRALRSDAYYVGALGSRRTQERRRERLRALGFGEADLARIHGPVGLDLGARTPAEIALSIAAELTACLRRPSD